MTKVDVHCHNFNADDLPVEGFVKRVLLRGVPGNGIVGKVLDRYVQGKAPGYDDEIDVLDPLLVSPVVAAPMSTQFEWENEIDEVMAELEANPIDRAMLQISDAEMKADDVEPGDPAPQEVFGFSSARRAVAWGKLLGKSRLEITQRMVMSYPNVDVFVPMLVDLAFGVNDRPNASIPQQVEMQEKVSRLSMMGKLLPGSSARVHPFVGFDPRSELRARRSGDIDKGLNTVKSAVTEYGFIGVKLYPPMGFTPTANAAHVELPLEDAVEINDILDEFFDWCADEHVPVTAHANASNESLGAFKLFSGPDHWAAVLTKPRSSALHLNLGHFGGARESYAEMLDEPERQWPLQMAALARDNPYLFADTGNHRIDKKKIALNYMATLGSLFDDGAATSAMGDRLMYGSDWFMLAMHPKWDHFHTNYSALVEAQFGADALPGFLGNRALRFLGFDTSDNKNRIRLHERYMKYAPNNLPSWLV